MPPMLFLLDKFSLRPRGLNGFNDVLFKLSNSDNTGSFLQLHDRTRQKCLEQMKCKVNGKVAMGRAKLKEHLSRSLHNVRSYKAVVRGCFRRMTVVPVIS